MIRSIIAGYISISIVGIIWLLIRWAIRYFNYRGRIKVPLTDALFSNNGGLSEPVILLLFLNAIAAFILLFKLILILL
jgi:hypothetical protein